LSTASIAVPEGFRYIFWSDRHHEIWSSVLLALCFQQDLPLQGLFTPIAGPEFSSPLTQHWFDFCEARPVWIIERLPDGVRRATGFTSVIHVLPADVRLELAVRTTSVSTTEL
jgi:hypothetical protein